MKFLTRLRNDPSFKTSVIYTIVLRVIYSTLGAVCAPYLKLDPALIKSNDFTENIMTRDAGLPYRLLGVWERFDTLWYLHIAQYGYDRPESTVFYPLYPFLIRALTPVVRYPLAAAMLISTVAAFFLIWGFQKLLTLDLPTETVGRALLLYAVWPASFMLFAGYPDSMVIALMIWSIYCARRGRWWAAGALGFFAGLSKAAGSLILIPLAVIAWRDRDRRGGRGGGGGRGGLAWPAALSLLAPALIALTMRLRGFPPLSEIYSRYWNTEVAFPWTTLYTSLWRFFSATPMDILLGFNLLMLALVFAPSLVKRVRIEYALFALSALALFLMKKTDPLLQSTGRYVLAVFPSFASWALLVRNRFVFTLILAVMLIVNLLLLMAFFEWALVV